MIEVDSLHHVSISVTDIEKAKNFYSNILGFQEISRPDFHFGGAWYDLGGQQLHLIVCPESETLRSRAEIEPKAGHFAVRVKNFEKTADFLKQQEVPIKEKRESVSGFAQIFCVDPDNNLIEFNVNQKDLTEEPVRS